MLRSKKFIRQCFGSWGNGIRIRWMKNRMECSNIRWKNTVLCLLSCGNAFDKIVKSLTYSAWPKIRNSPKLKKKKTKLVFKIGGMHWF